MATHGLAVRTRAHSGALRAAAIELEDKVWGPLGFLNFTKAHRTCYSALLDDYADLQLCLVEEATGELLALANCVPAAFSGDPATLPAEGWDWLVEDGGRDTSRPNLLGALAISVAEGNRGKGYATRMIRELKELAQRRGYEGLIAPVRPSAKYRHPLTPIADYVEWKDRNGNCYDPWLRSHLGQGAHLIRPCERSMVVEEDLAFWESWGGRRFERSGLYEVEGALVPVKIDVDSRVGLYQEPNVWVGYRN